MTRADLAHGHYLLGRPIHRLPAGVKMAAAMGGICAIVSIPRAHAPWLAAAAAALGLAAIPSRLSWKFLARRMVLVGPLAIGAALLSLFQPGGGKAFLFLVAKAVLCLFTMTLLAGTTPFAEMLRVLRTIRMPALLVTTAALMYRYLFVLSDEAGRMKRARTSRTFTPHRARSWWNSATVLGHLFIRASERAERIYTAMCARGWP